MLDPRPSIIEKRLAQAGRILAISGGKGGIGKSSIACMLALFLSGKGYKTGLFDLDFGGPSDHILLGINGVHPEELNGLVPPEVYGIRFMSLTYFTGNNTSPLRGSDISNVLIELFAITQWGKLDFLVIDMPPGLGDTILDVVRLIRRMEFIAVTTGSRLALEMVGRELSVLTELRIPVVGLIENMKRDANVPAERKIVFPCAVPFLGSIDFDTDFETALGNVDRLRRTRFISQLESIVDRTILMARQKNHG